MKNEGEFVHWVSELVNQSDNLLGHDEDAVATMIGDEFLVINIDGWVESTDRPPGMTPRQCGIRAVANAASDVLAKGARPEAMIISMSMGEKHQPYYQEVIKGFAEAAEKFGIAYLGGDMNTANDLVIDVTVWGRTDRLVRRRGAEPGQVVWWMGPPLGSTAVALGILLGQLQGEIQKAIEIMGYPQLYHDFLEIPANSSIDCSDGLARSLHLLANASGVGIDLDPLTIEDHWIEKIQEDNNKLAEDLIFYGGEELGIVFSLPMGITPANCVRLGKITKRKGVRYGDKELENLGWDHFSDTK